MVNEKMSFKVFFDFNLEVWVKLVVYGFKYQKLMLLFVKELRCVWECGGLIVMCVFVIVMFLFDISFDDMVI